MCAGTSAEAVNSRLRVGAWHTSLPVAPPTRSVHGDVAQGIIKSGSFNSQNQERTQRTARRRPRLHQRKFRWASRGFPTSTNCRQETGKIGCTSTLV